MTGLCLRTGLLPHSNPQVQVIVTLRGDKKTVCGSFWEDMSTSKIKMLIIKTFVYLIGNKNTAKAIAQQADSESDTEDEEATPAAPQEKKYESQISIPLLINH